MNNNAEGIEQELREEAERFLHDPPVPELVRTLRARQQRRGIKRIASLAAGLLLLGATIVGYRLSQTEQIAADTPQARAQLSVANRYRNSIVADRERAMAPAHAPTSDNDQLPGVEAVSYESLTPAEQFAVRRFLETENGLRSTELLEISL
jgi:hypothetical protein